MSVPFLADYTENLLRILRGRTALLAVNEKSVLQPMESCLQPRLHACLANGCRRTRGQAALVEDGQADQRCLAWVGQKLHKYSQIIFTDILRHIKPAATNTESNNERMQAVHMRPACKSARGKISNNANFWLLPCSSIRENAGYSYSDMHMHV